MRNLLTGIASSAIVVILDRLGFFEWLLGVSLFGWMSGLLLQRFPAFYLLGGIAGVFLLGLYLGRRDASRKNAPSSLEDEGWLLPPDQERALRMILGAGGALSANVLQEQLGATHGNFDLLIHELEDAGLVTSRDPDPYRIIHLLELGKTYLAQRTRQVRGRLA